MPELPEVETVRRRLRRVMEGARIVRVELRRKSLRRPLPPDFVLRLERQQVIAVERRAKYLVVTLSSGDALLMHLGMSGSFRVEAPHGVAMPGRFRYDRSEDARHDHVLFELSSGVRVIFNDPRRFGSMAIVRGADLGSHAAIGALGPEPLDRSFTAQMLAAALRGRTVSLKVALGDQRIIAGLGNIYVSEALHEARLSPKRRAGTLVTRSGQPRPQLVTLVSAIRDVLRKAIARQARYRGDDDRILCLRPRGRTLPSRRMSRDDSPHRAGRAVHVLLRRLPEVTSVYPWKGAAAETFALQQRAQLAGLRGEARYSLSPTSFLDAERGLRCVLSSPNGVELTLRAAQTSAVVLAGCLRNAAAVARVAQLCGHTFNVCPAGERWSDGSLRPAIEDWLAAGAIIASLPGPRSPEAAAAKAAFESVRGILPATLAASSSGRELIERGFSQDVELAAELNVSAHVPRFVAGAFVAVTSPGTLRREGPAR